LPPVLAGGKRNKYEMALAKKEVILAKAISYSNFISPPAKAGGNLILRKSNTNESKKTRNSLF
jgi:hypothetical protein